MMNPYELNWPGLRDVPVVTVDKAVDVIYSQENLLPLKRGKLDRLEYKYVPIEAVLDEFNAEIELEEAFETLESILDIPGVKPLYTDKSSGRKYVHVSSLLALIVLRPEDGPGFETACHSILHFLMNHLEMACLECGFIRRDCLCQVYDVCLDPKNIECVSYAKQSAEKDCQTDPIEPGAAASLGGPRPGTATTVFLPPGANLSNCEQLPDGRLNIKYVKTDGKGEVMTHHVGPHGMHHPGMMLPPGTPYYPGTSSGFVPPTVPVCPGMMATPGGYMPITTSPLNMMSTMIPTTNMALRHMGPAMYGPGMYPGLRGFHPNSPVFTTASSLAGQFQTYRMPMPTSQSSVPVIKLNSLIKKDAPTSAPDKGKSMKRSHEKQVEVSEEPKTLAIVNKRRRKSLIVPLKDGPAEEKEKKSKAGRKIVTLTKMNSQGKKTDKEADKEKESEKSSNPKKDIKKSKSPETKGSPVVSTRARTKSESLESPTKENPPSDVNGESKDSEKANEEEKEKSKSEEKEQVANGDVENDEKEEKEEEDKSENMDTKDVEKDEKESATAVESEKTETVGVTTIKLELESDNENASEAPDEVEMTQDGGNEENELPASPQESESIGSLEEQEQQKKAALYSCKGWDVFEYAPTGQQMIRCLRCGQCFDKENYAEQHNIMHTEQRSLRCTECDYTVSAARWYTLLRHLNSKHNTALVEEENSCKLCGNVFKDLEELEEHVDVHHYNKYKCTYCGTSLLTWDAYQHHVGQCPQLAQGKTYYSCPYCHFAFRDRLMKQVHVKSHQDDALVCCYCRDGKDWGNWKLLKNHYELLHLPKVKDRNPKKAKACPQCAQVFKSYKGFRNHVAKCTGPKKVEEVVEKKAEEEEDVKEKSKSSDMETSPEKKVIKPELNGENENSGKEDGEGEENADEGDEKENIQEGEENANETADSKTGVKKPRRRKRRFMKQKGPFKCEKCHKKFGAASTLDRHMSYAHGAEAKCDECDHVAKTPMLLKMHKTLKHSEKRHICSECNRTFMYYHQYKVHLAWHARKVAYACPTCDAEFPRQMELRQHQLTEHPSGNNRTVFTCSGCDFKCFSRTTLRAHLRNKHLSSDEEDDQSEDGEKKYRPDADGSDSDASRDAADKSDDDQEENSDSETESDVGEEDLQKLFSWRQSRPAPEGARRSSRTPKPSTKLVDIARTRKLSQRKKDIPAKKGRRRRSSSPRRPPSPQPAAARRRRPGMKGRPPKRMLKPRKIKKEKVEKKVKLRRCGCARFRTYAEFKILKKRMEDKRIVETTIVEDASTPMRRRTLSQESEPEPARPPKVEAPEVSWTYDTSLLSHELSPEERHQLMTVVLDHAYYQKPGPPPPEMGALQTTMVSPASDFEPKFSEPLQPGDPGDQTPGSKSPGKAGGAGGRRKRLSSSGSAAAAGQSPAKVRATVNDLESAIKFADNINQLSKLVSILRADKDEIPAAAATNGSPAVAISSPAASFLQSPPRTRIIPVAGNSAGASTMVTVTGVHGTVHHGTIHHGTVHHGTVHHGTLQRPSISDYEIGDIEPLPSDIMASEMDSDIDMQGVMSEILEEMRQGDNSGVSPDVSSAAEVLLSLDMSAEERELVTDPTRTGMLFTQSPAKKFPAVSVEYVNLGQNAQEEATPEEDSAQQEEQDQEAEVQQEVEAPAMEEEPQEEEMVLQVEEPEQEQEEQLTEPEQLTHELVTGEQQDANTFVIETVPLSIPKVAVELTNVNIPQNDFLFWAAKHDDSEEPQVAVVAAPGEAAEEEPAEGNEEAERTTWQHDHQYF